VNRNRWFLDGSSLSPGFCFLSFLPFVVRDKGCNLFLPPIAESIPKKAAGWQVTFVCESLNSQLHHRVNFPNSIVNVARVIATVSYHFVVAVWRAKGAESGRVKRYWKTVADNLSKAGWRCGCISSTDHEGRQFWAVAAERACREPGDHVSGPRNDFDPKARERQAGRKFAVPTFALPTNVAFSSTISRGASISPRSVHPAWSGGIDCAFHLAIDAQLV
jgi:hypothetical protein